MKKVIALALCTALVLSGCATAPRGRASAHLSAAAPSVNNPHHGRAQVADYVRGIPAGSRVRVELTSGRTLHGTLMGSDDDSVVVRPRTRVPEPPLDVPMAEVLALEIEPASNMGKVIAVGAAAGAAATLGVLLLLYALLADD